MKLPSLAALPLVLLVAAGCGSSSDAQGYATLKPPSNDATNGGQSVNGGNGVGAGSTGATGTVGALTTGAMIPVDLTTGGGAGGAPNAEPEVCDGVDNDGNGIVDDVDEGGDGVCDCLTIGTLGQIGPWSNGGNVFETWLNARSPLGATDLGDQVLTAEVLAPFQVIVVLHVDTTSVSNDDRTAAAHHEFSADEATAFGAWVEAGGGVMTTIGYTGDEAAEVANVNRLLNTLGMGYSATNLDLTGFIDDWDADHPVTMGVSNIFTDNGVEPAGTAGIVVAHNAEGMPALEVAETGSGRVVVWGDEWITYDSEWEDVEEQQVELFWINILKWLSPPMTCQVPTPPEIIK